MLISMSVLDEKDVAFQEARSGRGKRSFDWSEVPQAIAHMKKGQILAIGEVVEADLLHAAKIGETTLTDDIRKARKDFRNALNTARNSLTKFLTATKVKVGDEEKSLGELVKVGYTRDGLAIRRAG